MAILQTREISFRQQLIPIKPILTAILNLALGYDKAINNPSRYARFGYDFSEMITNKIDLLFKHGEQNFWVEELYHKLHNSLDSPTAIIEICQHYMKSSK